MDKFNESVRKAWMQLMYDSPVRPSFVIQRPTDELQNMKVIINWSALADPIVPTRVVLTGITSEPHTFKVDWSKFSASELAQMLRQNKRYLRTRKRRHIKAIVRLARAKGAVKWVEET